MRGALPHAIDSTAALTEAVLTDEHSNGNISPYALRLCYGTAFCRFVTGLVDSEMGKVKVSMFVKAQQIGIPASFVELRHEIAHAELPSLVVLRKAIERSMTWLWDDYWRFQDEASGNLDWDVIGIADGGDIAFRGEIRETLGRLIVSKTHGSQSSNGFDIESSEKATMVLTRICHGSKIRLQRLAKVLLETGFLIPHSKL